MGDYMAIAHQTEDWRDDASHGLIQTTPSLPTHMHEVNVSVFHTSADYDLTSVLHRTIID